MPRRGSLAWKSRRTPFAFRVVSREGPDVTLGDEFGMARRVTTAGPILEMIAASRRVEAGRQCGSDRLAAPRPSGLRRRRLRLDSFGASRLEFIKVGDDQQTSLFDGASREKR